MRSPFVKLSCLGLFLLAASLSPSARPLAGETGQGPALASIGPLTFAPDGTLFAADTQSAAIVALDMTKATGKAGARDVPALDKTIAAMLGTDAREILITDLSIHPKTRNAYISVMRGQSPALFRVDGAGKVEMVPLQDLKFSKVTLPDPAPATGGYESPFTVDYVKSGNEWVARNARVQTIMDMAFTDGELVVAGLSNEEFSSTLRTIPYPFTKIDAPTGVEIYHSNHNQVETRSPIYAFVPYRIDNATSLIAGYLCTPLVRLPLSSLRPGAHVKGTTIAELGSRNRPLDMITYWKGGREFLLMANTSRGVMKIPTETFGTAAPITTHMESGGVPFETIASMKGIEQLDLLDSQHAIVLARAEGGALNLEVRALP